MKIYESAGGSKHRRMKLMSSSSFVMRVLVLAKRASMPSMQLYKELKLATLGNGANSKDTIDTLKRCMVMRNRFIPQIFFFFFLQISYVEKVVQCWTF